MVINRAIAMGSWLLFERTETINRHSPISRGKYYFPPEYFSLKILQLFVLEHTYPQNFTALEPSSSVAAERATVGCFPTPRGLKGY